MQQADERRRRIFNTIDDGGNLVYDMGFSAAGNISFNTGVAKETIFKLGSNTVNEKFRVQDAPTNTLFFVDGNE